MQYTTIKGEFEHNIEINRSIFICSIKGITDFEQGMEYAKIVSKKYSDATHNCYALITKDNKQKFYDDGEPGGTAGQPMLQAIKNKELINVVAVVTRYFGGIKLGAGGLVSAYTQAVTEAINNAQTIEMALCQKCSITVEYNELPILLAHIRHTENIVLDTLYSDNVTLSIASPIEVMDKLEQFIASLTSGRSAINWQEKSYYEKAQPNS